MFRGIQTRLAVLYAGLFALALSLVAVALYVVVTTTAAAPVTPEGTTAFTCITPATTCGAAPAYRTSAATPPMVTVTGNTVCGNGAEAALPSTPGGEV